MKKLLNRTMAFVLCATMLLALGPSFAFGADEAEDGVYISAFAPLEDEVKNQSLTDFEVTNYAFPETLGAILADGETADVPVTWQGDPGFDPDAPAPGFYTYRAVPEDGYIFDDEANAPVIRFLVRRGITLFASVGTEAAPFEITSALQLKEIAELVNNGMLETFFHGDAEATVYLKLVNSIDLSAYGEKWVHKNGAAGWIPIGHSDAPGKQFYGHFDGGGFAITGLYIDGRPYDNTGLFGWVYDGTLENVVLEDVNVKGYQNTGGLAGVVGNAGSVDALARDCSVTGSVRGDRNTGGLLGYIQGDIIGCSSAADVVGDEHSGGLAGQATGDVSFSFATGSVTAARNRIGGLIGSVEGTVSNCYATGSVKGDAYLGGLLGALEGSASNCYATGSVTGTDLAGGLLGEVAGIVTGCYATGSVTTKESKAGGLVGKIDIGGTITKCAALGAAITIKSTTVHRVAGEVNEGTALADNYAFAGMTVGGNTVNNPTAADGANASGDSITGSGGAAGTLWDTLGWDGAESPWTLEVNKLPVLKNLSGTQTGEMPLHIYGKHFKGAGTVGEPYQITSAAELAKLAELVNADAGNQTYNDHTVYYKLMNDIDLSNYGGGWNDWMGWIPIGYREGRDFKSHFDGGGHVITGLFINAPSQGIYTYTGLFGVSTGSLQNLILEGVQVRGYDNTGGLVGFASGGSVTNCGVSGSVSGNNRVGGLAGYAENSTVSSCYATGDVTAADENAGGLVGYVSGGSVTSCYATGDATAADSGAGGLVGYANGGSVTGCYATGDAIATNSAAGGLVGYASGGSIINSAALGGFVSAVNGTDTIGRVVGGLSGDPTLSNNHAYINMQGFGSPVTGDVDGKHGGSVEAPEIIGTGNAAGTLWTTALSLSTSVWTLRVNMLPTLKTAPGAQSGALPEQLKGGLPFFGAGTAGDPYQIATAAELAKLAELVNEGDATYNDKYYLLMNDIDLSAYGADWNGGKGWIPIGHENDGNKKFYGRLDGGGHVITGLYISSDSYDKIGLFGNVDGGSLSNIGLEKVNVRGRDFTGGLVGYASSSSSIVDCYAAGSVSGGTHVGGLAGVALGNVAGCYAAGSVSGDRSVGGLAGMLGGGVADCYASAGVTGTGTGVGGLTGIVSGGGVVQNSYATGSVSGANNDVGGLAGLSSGSISNCYATGSVTGALSVGGLVGELERGDITNSVALIPSVTATDSAADIGRVAGTVATGDPAPTLSSNYAYVGMSLTKNGVSIALQDTDKGGDKNNGADAANPAALKAGEFWKADANWNTTAPNVNAWKDAALWTVADGKLPVLVAVVNSAGQNDIPSIHTSGLPVGRLSFAGEPPSTIDSPAGVTLTVTGFEGWDDSVIKWRITEDTEPTGAGTPVSAVNGSATIQVPSGEGGTLTVEAYNEDSGRSVSHSLTVRRTLTAADFDFDLTAVSYDGLSHAVSVTPKDGISGIEAEDIEVLYEGSGGAASTDAPTVVGKYTVIVNVAESEFYQETDDIELGEFTIEKAELSGASETIYFKAGVAASESFDLEDLLPVLEDGMVWGGGRTYEVKSISDTQGILSAPSVGVQTNPITIGVKASAAVGETAIITVEISSAYIIATAEITALASDRMPAPVTFDIEGGIYDGEARVPTNIVIGDRAVKAGEATFEYQNSAGEPLDPNEAPKDAGSYRVKVSVETQGDDPLFGDRTEAFVIEKCPVTVRANDVTLGVGGTLPQTWDYSVQGEAEGDPALIGTPALQCEATDTSTVATYPITVDMTGVTGYTDNYTAADPAFEDGTLTVAYISTGGGTTTPGTKTELGDSTVTTPPGGKKPVENDDGSLTLPGGGTVETSDGITIEVPAGTVIGPDGSVTVPDGKEAEVKLPDGTQVTVPGGSTVSGGGDITVGPGEAEVKLPGGTEITAGEGSTIKGDTITVGPGGATVKGSDGETYTFREGDVLILDEDVPLGFYAQEGNPFTDVSASDWFYEDVLYVLKNGLFKGTSATEFSPEEPLTRAMLVTVLWRMEGEPAPQDENPFSDLRGDWYRAAVIWAAENGIVTGYDATTFGPDNPITREQFATILYRYIQHKGGGFVGAWAFPLDFADAGSVSDWAYEALCWCTMNGILSGKPGNLLDPAGDTTRAEAAAMLHRFLEPPSGQDSEG